MTSEGAGGPCLWKLGNLEGRWLLGPELRDIGYQFEPPCYEPIPPGVLTQGTCAGEW